MAGKNLIVYYSRTGTSAALAKALGAKLGCDAEELHYVSGKKVSYISAAFEAIGKKTVKIGGVAHNASEYDQIFFISPIWAGALASPVRSYMAVNKDKIKSYALLVTCGGSGLEGAMKDAAAATGKPAAISRQFRSADIAKDSYDLEPFAEATNS